MQLESVKSGLFEYLFGAYLKGGIEGFFYDRATRPMS